MKTALLEENGRYAAAQNGDSTNTALRKGKPDPVSVKSAQQKGPSFCDEEFLSSCYLRMADIKPPPFV